MTRLAFPVTLFYDIAWNLGRKSLENTLLYGSRYLLMIFLNFFSLT